MKKRPRPAPAEIIEVRDPDGRWVLGCVVVPATARGDMVVAMADGDRDIAPISPDWRRLTRSLLDTEELRLRARAAASGLWHLARPNQVEIQVRQTSRDDTEGWPVATVFGRYASAEANAAYIAAVSPAVVLALLDRLEAAEKRAATGDDT